VKLKSFCTTKEMVSKLKRLPIEWQKIFANCTSDKGLITIIHREKCSQSLAIKKMQIKTILGFYLTTVRMAIIKNTNNNKHW
jgi:hypothetical protein